MKKDYLNEIKSSSDLSIRAFDANTMEELERLPNSEDLLLEVSEGQVIDFLFLSEDSSASSFISYT